MLPFPSPSPLLIWGVWVPPVDELHIFNSEIAEHFFDYLKQRATLIEAHRAAACSNFLSSQSVFMAGAFLDADGESFTQSPAARHPVLVESVQKTINLVVRRLMGQLNSQIKDDLFELTEPKLLTETSIHPNSP
jgi:hypothetical protein